MSEAIRTCRYVPAAISALVAGLWLPMVRADDVETESTETLIREWHSTYDEIADSFQLIDKGDESDLRRHAQPLLSYTNPVRRGSTNGRIYLWTINSRPRVIGGVWSKIDWQDASIRNVAFEFHSLSQDALSGSRGGLLEWSSREPGVHWLPLDKIQSPADSPADSRARRLFQMKSVMRKFRATIETAESELRLLDQPVFRYPDEAPGVVDGAIFAYVMGTDPELFAVIEAKTESETSPWRIAFARFTHVPMSVSGPGGVIWSCADAAPNVRTEPYMVQWKAERRDADVPADVRFVKLK